MHFTYRAHSFVSCFRELIIVDFRSRPQHTNPISHKFDRKKRCQNIHRVECQFHSVQAYLSCITTNCTRHNANVLAFVTFAISAKKKCSNESSALMSACNTDYDQHHRSLLCSFPQLKRRRRRRMARGKTRMTYSNED